MSWKCAKGHINMDDENGCQQCCAPTPREQELEAQNKALWELVGACEAALEWYAAGTNKRSQWDGGDVARQGIALIQKANESK